MEYPKLTEPGVKYFLTQSLKECRKFKDRNISIIFNLSMGILLFVTISMFLTYKYKGKPTAAEIAKKNIEKQEYIVSKLQQIALVKKEQMNKSSMITDLPLWNNHPESAILNRNIFS
tara:strand:+ start:1522 stop:1872 length:351 start_codon:yes stop_codon:yes gene_type:complete